MILPQAPEILLELYNLPFTTGIHASIFYPEHDPSSLPTPTTTSTTRPYVTLTFAQSLDAKIAGAGGKQLILSGKESLIMTHWMRTLHDAILVGVGTALNDDPQLNTRHLPPLPADSPYGYRLPRPVVLDTRLRTPPYCKLLQNYRAGTGRRPWFVCARASPAEDAEGAEGAEGLAFTQRAQALRDAGARVVEVDVEVEAAADRESGKISVRAVLGALHALGVRSLMVEGGASVIRSFLHAAREQDGHGSGGGGEDRDKCVDALVVTVAPTVVGDAGVGYGGGLRAEELPTVQHVRTDVFGPDAVMALKVL